MPKPLIFLIVVLLYSNLMAQEEVIKAIQLEPVTITAMRDTFSTSEFVAMVMNDTSFYQAFLNLKYYPHAYSSSIVVYGKNEKEKGKMTRQAEQFLEDGQRWVVINEEKTNGKIRKKNGEFKYLTAEMYDDVFFPSEKENVTNKIVRVDQQEEGETKLQKYKNQLKKLMFNPGVPIGNVPFIGDKLAIFSDEMAPYYNYSIYPAILSDSTSCYVFSCEHREGLRTNNTVIKEMTSYFDRETMQVIKREYRLEYNHLFFQFDITIKVDNMFSGGQLVPAKVEYEGWWDIPAKSPEIVHFVIDCADYQVTLPFSK